jgi:hypothetical protein
MNKVTLTSQVGADGVLKVSVPLKPEDANKTVRVTIEPLDQAEASATRPTTREEWLKFIEQTAGSITDPTFESSTDEERPPAVRDEFYAEASRLPETEEAFEAQKANFRAWPNDPRFEPYRTVLDSLIARDFATVRKWAAVQTQLPLEAYDYDALRAQEACDLEDARRRTS